jgi:hypothetical protein
MNDGINYAYKKIDLIKMNLEFLKFKLLEIKCILMFLLEMHLKLIVFIIYILLKFQYN